MIGLIALAAFISALMGIGLVGSALIRDAANDPAPAPLPVRSDRGLTEDPTRFTHSGATAAGSSETLSINA